jgi:hypothetical protein
VVTLLFLVSPGYGFEREGQKIANIGPFPGLLNAIDGISGSDGRLLFMTT